jgi:hypothetical protein
MEPPFTFYILPIRTHLGGFTFYISQGMKDIFLQITPIYLVRAGGKYSMIASTT